MTIENSLEKILKNYQDSFTEKNYSEENNEYDLLMNVFNVTPDLKRENRQYWGRELGYCWQLLVVEICKTYCTNFKPALVDGDDEPCDLVVGNYAIDTKYRISSGDSGTLKKFKSYGPKMLEEGYEPILLILRTDNLPAAIKACQIGKWKIYTGDDSFNFLKEITNFDLKSFLRERGGAYPVNR